MRAMAFVGGGKHGTDLIGNGDSDDALVERHGRAGGGFEHEPSELMTTAYDRQLGTGLRKAEAFVAKPILEQRHHAAALQPRQRAVG